MAKQKHSNYNDKDKETAAKYFLQLSPIIAELFEKEIKGICHIEQLGITDPKMRALDMNKGCDEAIKWSDDKVMIFGSRIQTTSVWDTITIRQERLDTMGKTELAKRWDEIQNNNLMCEYSLMAYIINGDVQQMIIVKTKELVTYVMKNIKRFTKEAKISSDENDVSFISIRYEEIFAKFNWYRLFTFGDFARKGV